MDVLMPHYLFESSGGVQVLRSDAPEPHWQMIPDESVDALWQAVAENRPVHIHGGLLDIGEAKADLHAPGAWDWSARAWLDPRTLAERRAVKNAEITAARLQANQTSFTYLGQEIAVDALSRSDIDCTHGVVLLTGAMPPGWQGGWKTVANTYVPIPDVATWSAFYLAMNSQGARNFDHSQALKAQLAAATSFEAIDAITWSHP
jgi:hypothetical protein